MHASDPHIALMGRDFALNGRRAAAELEGALQQFVAGGP